MFDINRIGHITMNLQPNFDNQVFNKMWDDMKIIKEIKQNSKQRSVSLWNPKTKENDVKYIPNAIIDDKLASKSNWWNPYAEKYQDPTQLSKDRLILISLVNKFSKEILVLPMQSNRSKHTYIIPGGRPFIFENKKIAAERLFTSLTGISIEQNKLVEMFREPIILPKNNMKVYSFLLYVCNDQQFKESIHTGKTNLLSVNKLLSYPNDVFRHCYATIYLGLLQHLY